MSLLVSLGPVCEVKIEEVTIKYSILENEDSLDTLRPSRAEMQ